MTWCLAVVSLLENLVQAATRMVGEFSHVVQARTVGNSNLVMQNPVGQQR